MTCVLPTASQHVISLWKSAMKVAAASVLVLLVHSAPALEQIQCGIANVENESFKNEFFSVQPGGHPWIAKIRSYKSSFPIFGDVSECIGVIVSAHYMITLSECVSVDKRKFDVLLGKSKVACKGCGRGAMKINNHSRAVFGNIAILKMDKPFKFAEQSRPICMPKLEDVYLTEKVSSVRWRTEKMGLTRRSQILEERNIGIFSPPRPIKSGVLMSFIFYIDEKEIVLYKENGRWFVGPVRPIFECLEAYRNNQTSTWSGGRCPTTNEFDIKHFAMETMPWEEFN